MRWLYLILILFALCGSTSQGTAQETLYRAWEARGDLPLVITAPWDSLFSLRDESYVDALLNDGTQTWDISLRLRGVSRRKDCYYKPFQINFKKKQLKNAGYEDFDKIKVVTQCLESEDGMQNVYEELLIYKIYNRLTSESFNARACSLTYLSADGVSMSHESIGIVLEPNDECFWRLNGEEVEQYSISADSLEPLSYLRTSLFHFMIGNLDWNVEMLQNIKLVRRKNGLITVVPYDFDYSAIVSPPYARLNPDVGQIDFRDRYYRGRHFTERLPEVESEFLARQDEILTLVDEFPYLNAAERRRISKYLRDFFKYLEQKEEPIVFNTHLPFDN